jgi:hypothetical protein
MRNRPFLFAMPWVLVLIAAPEFLGNVYSLHLPPTLDARLPVFGICIAIVYAAPVVGIVLVVAGLVRRLSLMAIHGGVTCLLSLGILVYANTIPPKRFYAAHLISVGLTCPPVSRTVITRTT